MAKFTEELVRSLRDGLVYIDGELYKQVTENSCKELKACSRKATVNGYKVMPFKGVVTTTHRFI